MVLANDDLDIDAEIVFVAKNLDDAPLGIVRGRRPARDLDIDYHSFEIVPFPAMRFLAIHAIAIVLHSARSLLRLAITCSSERYTGQVATPSRAE